MKLLINKFKTIDTNIKKLMVTGLQFSTIICFISAIVLFTYELFYNSPDLYYIGLSIFSMGITFIATFVACGFAFNEIKRELN